jgi:DUF4097 and DUF4098 domain-containing protein YvlB
MTMTTTRCLTMVCLAAGLALPVLAQRALDERRPAAADGQVKIENATGRLKVTGWDKAEVAVSGRLGVGAEGLSVETEGKRTVIEFDLEHAPQAEADVEISVPAGSTLEIEGFNVETSVAGVRGDLRVETVNGGVRVTGAGGALELHTVNGAIEADGSSTRVQAEAVNGAVTLTGLSGNIEASTVNGPLVVAGGRLTRGEFESVAGPVKVQAGLSDGARLDVQTVSGAVELALPEGVSAAVQVSTFSGSIVNEFGPQAASGNRFTTQKSLSFTAGSGAANVEVQTLSGNVTLRRR